MELQNIITQLQKPLQKKRKLFVLVLVLVLFLGGIGAAYFFHLESEKERLIAYKTQQIDNYFQKLTRKLENDLLIIKARDPEIKKEEEQTYLKRKQFLQGLKSNVKRRLETGPKLSPQIDSIMKQIIQSEYERKLDSIQKPKNFTKPESATNSDIKNNLITKSDCNLTKDLTRKCLDEFVEDQLSFRKDFDEYILKINNNKEEEGYSSSFKGLSEKKLIESIEDKTLFSLKKDFTINHEEYLMLGKRYTFKPNLIDEFEIEIYGLIAKDNFRQEAGQIDPAIVALLVIVLIILVVGLPFLKLVFISEDERLLSSDVLFAGLSTILGAPILLILLLSTFYYYRDFDQKNDHLIKMAMKLKDNFEKENNEIVKRASNFQYNYYRDSLDSKYRYFDVNSDENIKDRNKNLFKEFQFPDYDSISKLDLNYFKYVSEIYSLDTIINKDKVKQGDVRYHVNYMAKPPAGKAPWNLSNRSYYKDLKAKNNLWMTNGVSYVMRPVVSIENSAEEAVYALENPKEQGIGTFGIFAVQLKSLHSTSLPVGYNFAVVDDAGEVWFHSQLGKSTLENLFSNSTDDKKLEAGILGRIKATGTFNYHGERKLYSSLPIGGTNLSVVTFYDIELIGLRITESLSITTIIFLIILIFMAFVVLVSVFLKNPKWGLYKFYSFPFQFLLPKREFLKAYHFLAVFFTVLFLVLSLIKISQNNYSFNYVLGLVIIYWSYMLSYYVLRANKEEENKLNLTNASFFVITLLLNLIIIKLIDGYNVYTLIGVQFLFLIPILLSYTKWFKSYIYAEEKSNSPSNSKSLKYKYSYVNFLAVWLFSSTLMPAFIFFENSKHINEDIWQRAGLYEYLSHRQSKEQLLKTDILKPIYQDDYKNVSRDSIFSKIDSLKINLFLIKKNDNKVKEKKDSLEKIIKSLKYSIAHEKLINSNLVLGNYYPRRDEHNNLYYFVFEGNSERIDISDKLNDTLINELIWQIRPIYKEKSRQYQHFSQNKSKDESWVSLRKNDTLQFQLKSNNEEPELPTVSYYNDNTTDRFIGLFFADEKRYGILNLFGSLIIFGSFYWLILFYVDRCFAFRFFYLDSSVIDKKQANGKSYAEKLMKIMSTSKGNSGLFMIGLPSTGKQTFAENILEGQAHQTISCALLSNCSKDDDVEKILHKILVNKTDDSQSIDSPYFIIQNFEHNLLSFEENHIKIKLISYLLGRGSKLVITSEIYPNQLLDTYRDQVNQSGELKAELASDYNNWRDILGRFHQILLGITKQDELVSESLEDIDLAEYEEGSLNVLKEEFGHSKYLPSLSPVLLKKCTYSKIKDDKAVLMIDSQRMVLHAMMTAHGYYTDIWNSLPRREKYILFDIAKDGFMNIKNSISLFSLMKKGLIVWDDIPRIFNKSFRNFIISNGEKDIVLSKERRNTGGQNWGTTKIILMVIILAIIVFIVIGNPGIINNLESFIGALAGLGAIIPILSSILGKSRKAE